MRHNENESDSDFMETLNRFFIDTNDTNWLQRLHQLKEWGLYTLSFWYPVTFNREFAERIV